VQTADCVPILLFDPVNNVIAAVHAGWRGTVKKIAEIAVQKMIKNYNSSPKDILAAIGPSISPDIYEVGSEVVEKARQSIPNTESMLHKEPGENFHFNLWEANRQILMNIGLFEKNIEILGECSYTESSKYFSARKEGIQTGRMVSGIMLLS
jgi:YfiH family protein